MTKDFLIKLVSKPNTYILVWAYIYSRLDEQNQACIYVYEIIGKYKIPKSTIKRIVSYGVSVCGFKVNHKWLSNSLHIKILSEAVEPETNPKEKKSKPKMVQKRTRKPASTLYTKMIEYYDEFCLEITGVGCKIDGAQGKSLKQIIKFLETQCKKKNELLTEEQLQENVLLSWQYILQNWDKLDDFNKGKVKLTEINSNMLNILQKLKQKPKINKNNRDEQISQAIRGASDADYSGLGSR